MNGEELLKKRLNELSHRAFERGCSTFSDFLNLDEISILKSLRLESGLTLYGGYDNADRCVAGFGTDISHYDFPIICIKIEPSMQKFADKLSHRDFLGALINLGISRNTLGDIVISDNTGYLFCLENIGKFINENLVRVCHTTVKCEIINDIPEIIRNEPDPEEIVVSSQRADAIISAVFKLSRNQTSRLFNQEKVFINSRAAYKEALTLKENDIVSVRGCGKFIFSGSVRKTKKGRTVAEIKKYK